jgi:hypothetical protein
MGVIVEANIIIGASGKRQSGKAWSIVEDTHDVDSQ